jgi:DNA polymerase III subunit epsilon
MIDEKLLFVDTETGGTDPDVHSLLSIGLVVWQDFHVVDSLELLIKDKELRASPEALAINKINLKEHFEAGLDLGIAMERLLSFLHKHFANGEKVTVAGHNISFDIQFLKKFFKRNGSEYSRFFSHRSIDTSAILYYLFLRGAMKKKSISSDSAFDEFGIRVTTRHSALDDALATAELFNKLLLLEAPNTVR